VGLLLRVLINAAALWVAASLIPGIRVDGVGYTLLAALVLGIINAIVRPVLVFLTFPITLLTLGLFIVVVNAIVFWLATLLPVGVHAEGFGGALVGAIVVSIVSLIASSFLKDKD